MSSSVRIELCEPKRLHSLRLRVLRPGQPLSSVDHEHDHWPRTVHVGAFDAEGETLACATFYPEETPDGRDGWRLRAMATAPEVRGQGYGSRTLRFGLEVVRLRGASLVWCNARSNAVWFYEHLGFTVVSDEFVIDPIGPHFLMEYETDRRRNKVLAHG